MEDEKFNYRREIIRTKPRTVITAVNKNSIYSTYPMFNLSDKLWEDTATIFKFTLLTL